MFIFIKLHSAQMHISESKVNILPTNIKIEYLGSIIKQNLNKI